MHSLIMSIHVGWLGVGFADLAALGLAAFLAGAFFALALEAGLAEDAGLAAVALAADLAGEAAPALDLAGEADIVMEDGIY